MPTNIEKNKQIAKNTLFMYFRMFIMMIISLFTARVVYNALGVEDYGTYNVVGSIIVFFTFLNSGLSAASNRFITAEVAKGPIESGTKVFNICFQSHALIAALVFILAETVGVFLVNNVLVIPEGRMTAANIVYQFSVITALINILYSPFNASLLSYEKMNIYAYISIFEAVNKLLVAYLIMHIPGDKLITYGFLIFICSILISIINYTYCIKKLPICRLKRVKDKVLLKSIFKFTSWSLFGKACVVGTNQGVSVLINVFNGVVVNAAMGVSNQITGIVGGFVDNFQVAFRPQITKSYVSGEIDYLQSLILRSSKIIGFLVLIFIVPIYIEIENVLTLWLGSYPEYAAEFCKWTLIAIFLDTVTGPLWMTINSQTNIKSYQIFTSLCFSLNFFLSWIVLGLNVFPPYSVIIIRAIVFAMLIVVRLYFTKKFFVQFEVASWIRYAIITTACIFGLSLFASGSIVNHIHLNRLSEIIVATLISEAFIIPLCYFFLFTKNERSYMLSLIRKNF